MGAIATKEIKEGDKIVPYVCAGDVMSGNFRVNGVNPYLMIHNGKQYSGLQYRSIVSLANSQMKPKVYGRDLLKEVCTEVQSRELLAREQNHPGELFQLVVGQHQSC